MEQRIGSSSQPLKGEPVTGAGFDPAFIPGLTSPATGEPEKAEDRDAVAEADTEAVEDTAEPVASEQEAAPGDDPAADAADGPAVDAADPADDVADDAGDDGPADGPVFEAADRRARIVADRKGVRLVLDDQECEFRWDEIGAVETTVPRFGKRLTITVHTPDRRWYPIEIEAPARSRFKEWDEQLDAVLDTYFEEDAE